jgi:hypothetical protein
MFIVKVLRRRPVDRNARIRPKLNSGWTPHGVRTQEIRKVFSFPDFVFRSGGKNLDYQVPNHVVEGMELKIGKNRCDESISNLITAQGASVVPSGPHLYARWDFEKVSKSVTDADGKKWLLVPVEVTRCYGAFECKRRKHYHAFWR